jgi:glycosyltransferase involved in cell wall biosynthesis
MNVHQLLSGAGPHDAITNEALQFRARFRAWGYGGQDFAARLAPGTNGAVSPLAAFAPRPEDLLLLHHSARAPRLAELLGLPNRQLLLYHNVTPAEWLWDQAPITAVLCHVGRDQLRRLVERVEVAAADSSFNAAELRALGARRTEVIPLLVDLARLGPPAPQGPPPGPPTILFVGRLTPNKRQDEVIRAFALYRRHRAPDARLVLVGEPITPAYGEHIRAVADALAPGAVTSEGGLESLELGDRYRSAHAFLCMSEHEGFCIPLLEAFHFGIPVIARPAGAIPETAGDAALLVDDQDLAVVAELLELVVGDRALRAELRQRGAARVAAYAPDVVAARLRAALQAARDA